MRAGPWLIAVALLGSPPDLGVGASTPVGGFDPTPRPAPSPESTTRPPLRGPKTEAPRPPTPGSTTRQALRSPAVVGLGPRLAAQIRGAAPDTPVRLLGHGLSSARVEAAGGRVTARIGPIVHVVAPARAVPALAGAGAYIDAPQPLRPALDVSRVQVKADETDFAGRFETPHRGDGVLIAAYDTGIDLMHPDLRTLSGESRVWGVWDQDATGTPPAGKIGGDLCDRARILAGACPHRDTLGHGTPVFGVAASSGPQYRGVAPAADLLVAASSDFEQLIDALDWFRTVAEAEDRPMVVNLSLAGQEGPHDGTSLEAQAIDALDHLVVVATGNEGVLGVHALARLDKGQAAQVALRFPILPITSTRRAVVDVWGDVGLPLTVQVRLRQAGGEVVAETEPIAPGDDGRTVPMQTETATVGWVQLDADAEANPFNGQGHVRVEIELPAWEDDPNGLGYVAIEVRGEGRVDLWVDTPASEPAPVRFDRDRVLGVDDQVLGDSEHSISDIATAASAVAVSAYIGRTEYTDTDGAKRTVSGSIDSIAPFSAYGPTLSPSTTGAKPDLAAPGLLVIAAHSRDAPTDPGAMVSDLYRAAAGTSLAAPHVSGAAALILGARPETSRADVKAFLLDGADDSGGANPENDTRWGEGRLDVAAALARVVEERSGCRCAAPRGDSGLIWLAAIPLLLAARRRRASDG